VSSDARVDRGMLRRHKVNNALLCRRDLRRQRAKQRFNAALSLWQRTVLLWCATRHVRRNCT
jgi:hypothetical protein